MALGRLLLLGLLAVQAGAAGDEERMRRGLVERWGQGALPAYHAWRELISQGRNQVLAQRLEQVNSFFNRQIRFTEDTAAWGQIDYWASPLESLGNARGDCDDYAIAKYFTLLELGVPAEQLRMTYVRARIGGPHSQYTQAHMVLSWYASPDAEPLVLDNLIGEIRPASRRPDLTPVFSFNSLGLWTPGSPAPSSSADRLTRWRELLLRMKAEGYEP